MKRTLAALVVLLTSFSAHAQSEIPSPVMKPNYFYEIARSNNALAVDIYKNIDSSQDNIFFSPQSILTALAMTYSGARGDTATQMAHTLHLSLMPPELAIAMKDWLKNFTSNNSNYKLAMANALWIQKGYLIQDNFLRTINTNYGAGLYEADFKSAPDSWRATINQWVEEQTQNKISNLISKGLIDTSTRLVLTNAIYFKGVWLSQFDKAQTSDDSFFLGNAKPVSTHFMHLKAKLNYLHEADFQAVEIPYAGDHISMVVFLPDAKDGLAALEKKLTPDMIEHTIASRQSVEVDLALPKFKTDSSLSLRPTLEALGLKDAFNPSKADFSGITGNKELSISAVIHKAFIDVNEEGTEAAAATAITMSVGSLANQTATPIFKADHPFFFVIRENHSGNILFMGRIITPTK